METNRKILFAIMGLFILCAVLAVINIGVTAAKKEAAPQSEVSSSAISMLKTIKRGNGVGVVRIEGVIQFAESNQFGMQSGAEATISRLNALASNKDIKAIVLRINSPGGTVAATQEIYQRIMEIREDIPVIASIGEIGASGGYYLASAAELIYANPGSMTGSIGVIAYSPNMRGLFEKIGVSMNVIKSGRYKDIMSSHRNMTDEERRLIQSMIDSSYNQFLQHISEGRDMPVAKIAPYADGRILDGVEAKRVNLIDEIGTFQDAIAKAKELAELPEDAPVYDDAPTFQNLLFNLGGMIKGKNILEQAAVPANEFYRLEYRCVP